VARPGARGPNRACRQRTHRGSRQRHRAVVAVARGLLLPGLKSGDIRPLITDLKLVAIIYDERYAARSVAVLRDISTSKRYRVRTGDVLGRLRITQIKPRDVVFTIQEFGFERQATLSLAKQEETP
jgi:hypothetical protein